MTKKTLAEWLNLPAHDITENLSTRVAGIINRLRPEVRCIKDIVDAVHSGEALKLWLGFGEGADGEVRDEIEQSCDVWTGRYYGQHKLFEDDEVEETELSLSSLDDRVTALEADDSALDVFLKDGNFVVESRAIGSVHLRDHLGQCLRVVKETGERLVVCRRGTMVAALVTVEDLQVLEKMEDDIDRAKVEHPLGPLIGGRRISGPHRAANSCTKCDGLMYSTGLVKTSDPPWYVHKCEECGYKKDFLKHFEKV